MSKETPNFIELNPTGEYTVTFDPIDGGTIIDANYSVASIFGIWKNFVNGSTGRDLKGAALSIYGSRTTMVLYNTHAKQVEELTLVKRPKQGPKWIVTIPKFEF